MLARHEVIAAWIARHRLRPCVRKVGWGWSGVGWCMLGLGAARERGSADITRVVGCDRLQATGHAVSVELLTPCRMQDAGCKLQATGQATEWLTLCRILQFQPRGHL